MHEYYTGTLSRRVSTGVRHLGDIPGTRTHFAQQSHLPIGMFTQRLRSMPALAPCFPLIMCGPLPTAAAAAAARDDDGGGGDGGASGDGGGGGSCCGGEDAGVNLCYPYPHALSALLDQTMLVPALALAVSVCDGAASLFYEANQTKRAKL